MTIINQKEDLPPVGSKTLAVFPPLQNTTDPHFMRITYRIDNHCLVHIAGTDSPQQWSSTLTPIESERIDPVGIVFFMEKWWFVPPKSIWDEIVAEYGDLVAVLRTGILDDKIIIIEPNTVPLKKFEGGGKYPSNFSESSKEPRYF